MNNAAEVHGSRLFAIYAIKLSYDLTDLYDLQWKYAAADHVL
jgi:hypothetical protein